MQGTLNEMFSLAVGSGRIGLGADEPEAETFAEAAEGAVSVASPAVGHDPLDSDGEASVIGDGSLKKGDGADLMLARHDRG